MNYLEITKDKLKQTQDQIKRAEYRLGQLQQEEEELQEVIKILSQMPRYKGVEQ